MYLKQLQTSDTDGNHHTNRLMYADDLIILATSMEDLQKKLRFVRRVLCQMETRYKLQQNQMHDVLQRHSKRKTISQ